MKVKYYILPLQNRRKYYNKQKYSFTADTLYFLKTTTKYHNIKAEIILIKLIYRKINKFGCYVRFLQINK